MSTAITAEKIVTAARPPVVNGGPKLLFPGEDCWELYSFSAQGKRVLGTSEQLGDLKPKGNGLFQVAIPLHYMTILPLWLATEESSLIEDMLWLQLEKRGLFAGSRAETVVDHRILRQENGRSLLVINVLSPDFPEEWCLEKANKYILASDCLTLPGDQILLWRELGRLVWAFSIGNELVYVQSLSGNPSFETLSQELCSAQLRLDAEQVGWQPKGITVWGNVDKIDLHRLGVEFGLPVQVMNDLSVTIPQKPRHLTPYAVQQLHRQRNQQRRRLRLLCGLGLLYLLILILFLGSFGWLWWQKHGLEKELALHRGEVNTIRDTALRWQALEPAILPEDYPVEILYRCTRALPQEGVRIVKFDQAGQKVLIIGEAKNAPAAYKFVDDLKNNKDLAGYSWDMPPPKLLPNNSAQFQIEGKNKYAGTNSQ